MSDGTRRSITIFRGYTGVSAQLQAFAFARRHAFVKNSEVFLDQYGGDSVQAVREAGAAFCNDTNLIRVNASYKGAPPLIMPIIPVNPPYLMKHARMLFCPNSEESTDPEFTCAICQDHVCPDGHTLVHTLTPCRHKLHASCFVGMLDCMTGVPRCPTCREMLTSFGHPILDKIEHSVIVGNASDPFIQALKKMIRPEIHVKVSGLEMKHIVDTFLREVGFHLIGTRLPVPDLTDRSTYHMSYPRQSKGGLYRGDKHEDKYLNYRTNPTKEECYGPAVTNLITMLLCIKRYQAKTSTTSYGVKYWMQIACELRTKLEVQMSIDKLRIFFNPEMCKFLFDKVSAFPVYRYLYNRGPIMVGYKWSRNGASKLYRYLRGQIPGRTPTHFHWEWDFYRFDQSVKASSLLIAALLVLRFYDPNDPNFPLFKAAMAWSADNYAVKFVHWILSDEWRAVVGLIFSGEYGTSMIDSIISSFIFIGYCLTVMNVLQAHLTAEEFSALRPSFQEIMVKVYGDDGIASIPIVLRPYMKLLDSNSRELPHGLMSLQRYTKTVWDMAIKEEDSGEYSQLYSVPDAEGGLKLAGPKILQRHFIWRKYEQLAGRPPVWRVCGYRTSGRMMVKTFRTITDVSNKLVQVGRAIGMLWDTQGVNLHAWHILSSHLDLLEEEIRSEQKDPQYPVYEHLARLLDANPNDNITVEMVARLKKSDASLTIKTLGSRPTFSQVAEYFNHPLEPIDHFVYNDLVSWEALGILGER